MNAGGTPLWSRQQHAWLAALGHTVWVPGALPEAAVHVPAPVREDMREAVSRPVPPSPPRPQRQAPRATPEPSTVAAATSAPPRPRSTGSRLPDRLHIALIRASGCNPNTPEAAEIMASWPATSELRGNPAAKRALWPRLRALRRPRQ